MMKIDRLSPEERLTLATKRLWSLRNGRGEYATIEHRYRAIDLCEEVINLARQEIATKCH